MVDAPHRHNLTPFHGIQPLKILQEPTQAKQKQKFIKIFAHNVTPKDVTPKDDVRFYACTKGQTKKKKKTCY